MKITFVGSGVVSIPPKKGGATELIIYELSKDLSKKGNSVTVFDIKDRFNKNIENIEGTVYERFSVPRLNNVFFLRLSEFLFGMKSLVKSIGRNNDIIHCQTVFSSFPFAIFGKLAAKKTVYTSHNPAWTDDNADIFNRIIMGIEGFVMKNFDSVVTVSETMKKNIIKKAGVPGSKIDVIYNFVDTKRFMPRKSDWKSRMKIKGPIVLFVGKMIENKGVEYFIRSAAIVRNTFPDVKFVLVGPISFEQEGSNKWISMVDEMKLQDTIVFAGPMSNEDLPLAYSSADVFCSPTLKEAFGIVIIEAMSSGVPVVVTDLPVIREVVSDSGLFSKKCDTGDISSKIIRILRDKQLKKRLIQKSIRRAKKFDKDVIMNEYEKFYLQHTKNENL